MLTPTCDRCSTQNVQLYPVLDRQVCRLCLDETKAFLSAPPAARGATGRFKLTDQVMRTVQLHGRVTDRQIAIANSEPVRRAYHRLIGLTKQGRLVHLGHGEFALPRAEAAE